MDFTYELLLMYFLCIVFFCNMCPINTEFIIILFYKIPVKKTEGGSALKMILLN